MTFQCGKNRRNTRFFRAQNLGLNNEPYVTGLLRGDSVLCREANYHPDSGQMFFPLEYKEFILLLALPSDEVKAKDFRAFYFDGSMGCMIHPGVWHQPPYPLCPTSTIFQNAQGAVHACVGYDSIEEEGIWLHVDLKKNPSLE